MKLQLLSFACLSVFAGAVAPLAAWESPWKLLHPDMVGAKLVEESNGGLLYQLELSNAPDRWFVTRDGLSVREIQAGDFTLLSGGCALRVDGSEGVFFDGQDWVRHPLPGPDTRAYCMGSIRFLLSVGPEEIVWEQSPDSLHWERLPNVPLAELLALASREMIRCWVSDQGLEASIIQSLPDLTKLTTYHWQTDTAQWVMDESVSLPPAPGGDPDPDGGSGDGSGIPIFKDRTEVYQSKQALSDGILEYIVTLNITYAGRSPSVSGSTLLTYQDAQGVSVQGSPLLPPPAQRDTWWNGFDQPLKSFQPGTVWQGGATYAPEGQVAEPAGFNWWQATDATAWYPVLGPGPTTFSAPIFLNDVALMGPYRLDHPRWAAGWHEASGWSFVPRLGWIWLSYDPWCYILNEQTWALAYGHNPADYWLWTEARGWVTVDNF